MNTLFFQVYRSTSAKYRKFKSRLDKNIASGRFKKFTRHKKSQILHKLERLRRRLLQLQTHLKLASAGAAVSLFLNVNSAAAQTTTGPFARNYPGNPLPPPLPYINRPAPAYVDLDGDGDLDLVVGDNSGNGIKYFKNIGTKSKARFLEIKSGDAGFPFSGIISSIPVAKTSYVPAFADVDGDGDFDLLMGTNEFVKYGVPFAGDIFFFRNNGTQQAPDFSLETGAANPFVGVSGTLAFAHPFFVDMDSDGDQDLWLGGYYDKSSHNYLIQYFENKGTPTSPNYVNGTSIFPEHPLLEFDVVNNLIRNDAAYHAPLGFADMDEDGDLDFFISISGEIIYYRNDNGFFSNEYGDPTQTGPWIPNPTDPGSSQGNPFDVINDNISNSVGYTSFAFADLDNDGDLDVTISYNEYDFYLDRDLEKVLFYYENKGQGVFELKENLSSPVDGVDVLSDSNASFADLDSDGDLDILAFGSVYDSDPCGDGCSPLTTPSISIFGNNQGTFEDVTASQISKFDNVDFAGEGNTAKLLYVDDDNVPDLVVPYFISPNQGKVRYFELINGAYQELTGANNPFDNILEIGPGLFIDLDIGDLNNDGLPDLVLAANDKTLTAWKNTGTKQNPVFTREVSWEGGLVNTLVLPKPKLLDIDSDGDLDIIVGKYDGMWYYENVGTPSSPSFVERNGLSTNNPFLALNVGTFPRYAPGFNDFDNDGDLDLLAGDVIGQFQYFENTNPAPVTTLAATLNFSQQSGPIVLDASLTLSDPDGDLISSAIISIVNFKPGQEVLSFTPQAGITGVFDTSTGVLTLSGRASISTYVAALRTVSYQFTGPTPTSSGRSGRTKAITLNRSITFAVLDQDRTQPVVKTLAVQVSFGNQPPVIADNNGSTQIGNTIELNFTSLITDPDDNLDAASLRVVQAPGSGASYVITGLTIKLDYTGTDFAGPDQFTIEVCDLAGACTQKVVNIQVEGEVVAYNGISPNGDGVNDFFELKNIVALEPSNKVSIYTRWGDKIFEVENYDNDLRKFVGLNNSGNQLTSGVYFYKVEFTSGRKELTGYLTIKR